MDSGGDGHGRAAGRAEAEREMAAAWARIAKPIARGGPTFAELQRRRGGAELPHGLPRMRRKGDGGCLPGMQQRPVPLPADRPEGPRLARAGTQRGAALRGSGSAMEAPHPLQPSPRCATAAVR